jgi:hypothetical protein
MLTETTGRTAQDLAAELTVLRGVDWASVWAGPPQSGIELRQWCGRYGWEPLTTDRQLVVRGRAGGELTFYANGLWAPVTGIGYDAWRVRAGGADANAAVLSAAVGTWPSYLEAAVDALGTPVWTGSWEARDFPEPAEPSHWDSAEARMRKRSPYRLAYWAVSGAVFVLRQTVAFPTWTQDRPGSSMITLSVYPEPGKQGAE